MSSTLPWLVAFLAFASLTFLADGAPLQVMSAPNLLRVGTAEKIFVECQDCTGGDIPVEIIVRNHPTKTKRLANTTVTLTGAQNFQALGEINIPVRDFSKDPIIKQYVYLQAQFPGRLLEKIVLVSFQSGYIFIQTDKTLYTPNSNVNYRMFALTPRMEPIEREGTTQSPASITVEIVTPGGIVLSPNTGSVSLNSGIHSGVYKLSEIASLGLWKVVAKFHSNPQQIYSAEFEVKEYVLPSFEVKLTSQSPFFYVDSEVFEVDIKAEYLFGEEVNGMAYVVFGVMHEGGKKSFPSSLQRVPIMKGNGVVTLERKHITEKFNIEQQLVGSSIYVAVTVLTENGSEMVEAELRGIQIVTSPYTIHFKRTPKYYKPGMSFDVTVEVVNPDDSPADSVDVVVDPGQVQGSTAANGLARLTINTDAGTSRLTVTAKTNVPGITRERQATATMEALPYKTTNNNYIHIGVDAAELKLGDNLKVSFIFGGQQSQTRNFTYLILSKGQLVKRGHGKVSDKLFSKMVLITKEMLPSFRIIAYFHTDDNEVVADSVWVDVKDSCMGSLKLEISKPSTVYSPSKTLYLKVTGDPEAKVGMVAVDKGVYVLNNKHRLTQKKVWDIVEKYDTGCTPGGGKDSMSVFYDAGLLFESNTASGTPYRQELKCPAHSRRKRTTIMDVITSLASQYNDPLQRECCKDGMVDLPLSYSCEVRSEYIGDGAACVEAFLHCCKEMENQRAERRQDSLQLARSEEDDKNYMDSNEIVTRTKFPESWLWKDINLPACSQQIPNCRTTSVVEVVRLQDSITTWQFTGISLSRTHGICVGKSLEVIVRKEFFIDLRLPYSAVQGEQLEVKAILHNYSPDEITVRVDLTETEHVCSVASKHGRYRQEVKMGGLTTLSVPFIIIPMKDGQYSIKVKAIVKDSGFNDGIEKKLRVVPPGVFVSFSENFILNPAEKGEGHIQKKMRSQISMKDVVPKTPRKTEIFVRGREQVAGLVENAISGNSMGTLIIQPSGCGEQNMIYMTLPLIAAIYLDKTNQWETVGLGKRYEALQHIKTGYENELNFRKDDGSFAVYHDTESSTWLTAYVAKVFAMASSLVAVQDNIICDAVKFLILNAQQPGGMFIEVGQVYSSMLNGDVEGRDSEASMTAFCLIAMQESYSVCNIPNLSSSINKAVAYLENRLPSLTYSYAVAMTSYALANANKLNKKKLMDFASADLSHWPVSKGNVYTLEATAYALLALVKVKAFQDARRVVRWFNEQQRQSGNYGSTQATMMVYQATAEYWAIAPEPPYNLSVDIELPGRSLPLKYVFDQGHFATRTSNMNYINKDVTVTATGTGEAIMTMVSFYYALPKEKENNCQNFNLSVQLIQAETDSETYKLKINYFFKNKTHDAGMSILDIGLLTGFTADTNDLKLLSSGHAKTMSKFEMNTALSEKGSLIIYLDKVSHTREEEITFHVNQKHKVGVFQPAAVSIYEYYEQTPCVKFYHPERRSGELLRLCKKDVCTCAEENCSMQKKGNIDNRLRTEKSCETTPTSKIVFVYKVSLEKTENGLSTDIYTMRVLKVIKEGSSDVNHEGQLRTFLSFPHCRVALDLVKGKNYLIMGTSKDIHRDDENNSFLYVLGETTWIEYWPTDAECQMKEHKETCEGLEQMQRKYEDKGCEE
ncbi:complement C3-like isoform X1 [Larimichthys crocea]|uniref:complement C3-like isoform X1 n=1 Tax=Larimichthys crocea TaxID=215358 RepID=UPI000F5FE62A|nr:complement C3-like isoform X1 [Larimichthys crocea]